MPSITKVSVVGRSAYCGVYGSTVQKISALFDDDVNQALKKRNMLNVVESAPSSFPIHGQIEFIHDWSLTMIDWPEIPGSPKLYAIYNTSPTLKSHISEIIKLKRLQGIMIFTFAERNDSYHAYINEFANRVKEYYRYGFSYNFTRTIPPKITQHLLSESNNIAKISPQDMERFVCDIFNNEGYSCERTIIGNNREYGDIYAFQEEGIFKQKIVIEVKRLKNSQRLKLSHFKQIYYGVGGNQSTAGLLITTGSISRNAENHINQEPNRWRFGIKDIRWIRSGIVHDSVSFL